MAGDIINTESRAKVQNSGTFSMYAFCILYFIFSCILCAKATVRAHLAWCLVLLPGLLCCRIIVLLLLNKINDDDDDEDDDESLGCVEVA